MNWTTGTFAFFLFLCNSAGAQNIPYFHTYGYLPSKKDKESRVPTIELVPERTYGASNFWWSGAFTSYHRMVVLNENDKLFAYCQTAGANNSIKSVSYFFTPRDKSVEDQQELKIFAADATSSLKWPIFGSRDSANDAIIPENEKFTADWPDFSVERRKLKNLHLNLNLHLAELVIKFHKSDTDMSGILHCQVEDIKGHKLTSNILKIVDIKKDAKSLQSVQVVSNGFFSSGDSGYSSFPSVPTNLKMAIQNVAKNVPIVLKWDIFTDSSSQTYEINKAVFNDMRSMQSGMLGKYVIDEDGTLYVNMWGVEVVKVRDIITGVAGNRNNAGKRLVLLMSDKTSKIGYKIHAKDGITKSPGLPTPKRILPREEVASIKTYVGNIGHTMMCGFLADSSSLQIVWKFNEQLVTENTLTSKYGMRSQGSGTMLDLTHVKIAANGRWSCHLLLNENEILKGNFLLRVIQYPTFGSYSDLSNLDGSPPRALFVMERSNLTLSCRVRSFDVNQHAATPYIHIDGIPFEQLCSGRMPSNQALCTMKLLASVKVVESSKNREINERTIVYTVDNLQSQDQGTSKSMSHLVTCSVSGKYDDEDEQGLEGKIFTAVNVVPRPKMTDFDKLPSNCSVSEKGCLAKFDHEFHCILKDSYNLQSLGIIIKKHWTLGTHTQESVMSLDPGAIAKNYTHFSKDGNTLTIKKVSDNFHRKTINTLSPIRCVVELYYPSNIELGLKNAEIIGDGVKNPSTPIVMDINSKTGPLIYSSYEDSSANHLIAHFELEGEPEPVVSEAGTNLFIPIGIASFLLLLILLLVVFIVVRTSKNKGASYHMGQKELDQGLDPILELKEQQNFKEYQRREEAPIRGSRWSMASSMIVKSQSGSVYLDEEYGDFEHPVDQPRFVGDRTGYADF